MKNPIDTVVVRSLTVASKTTKILNSIDLGISSSTIAGLIGPSGSGKSTLIRTIVGGLSNYHGSIEILGQRAGSRALRSRLSYMPQGSSIFDDLTVEENLRYFASLVIVGKSSQLVEVERLIDLTHLNEVAKQITSNLSGGQRQRVSLAITLIGDRDLLILDEPTVGLDPILREELWTLFRTLASNGKTLLVSSHSMDEASKCDDLILLRSGSILAQGSASELLTKTGTQSVEEAFVSLGRC
ncbi:MAG: ABC transporter ATP-binding protein [Actinomycetota bacterium]|nr:ABC transporter ATP-binding protein [Actinomycetota bacterium]